jgi:cell division protein DivIC
MKLLLQIFTNKFVFSILFFSIWMLYFDQNDYFIVQQHRKELQAIKDNVNYLTAENTRMEKEYAALVTNAQQLEKVARETYHMKRDNEDVYIIDKK